MGIVAFLKKKRYSLRRKRIFRQIRKGKREIRNLPPYERGLYYEDFVCRWMKTQGCKILDRNVPGPQKSEIDIVAKIGKTLIFTEVKARRKETLFSPLHSIDERKRHLLALATEHYLNCLQETGVPLEELEIRYDVACVGFDREGIPRSIEYYRGYLEPNYERF